MPDTEHGSFGSIAKVATAKTDPENGDEDLQFKPLTREEAQALRARHSVVSPWVVLGVQALAGLLVSAGVWLVWQQGNAVWSALYGAAAAVIPGAVMARGMSRQQASNSPGGGLTGFMFWEFAKVLTAVAMLVAAVKVVPSLHWPVLLVTMIVSLKVNWLALLWRRPSTQQQQETKQHGR